ncbi:MAG: MFS transporter [Rhodoferax sp.]|nr:MFS transporter [Rhodoferax sp.]MCF8210701.1 MFS transporter [Rhodoferax sp.]
MNILKDTLPYVGMIAFASMALTRVCDPMLTTLSSEFQVTVGQVSRVISWYAIAYGALQLAWGPLGDRLGKLHIVIWAGFACAILCFLAGFATDFSVLVVMRVAMGAAAAAIIPLSMAWIGDLVDYENRQATLARLMASTVTGMMAGQWFGGLAADYFGWRWAFFALSLTFLVATVLLHRRTRGLVQTPPTDSKSKMSFSQQMAKSGLLLAVPRVRWVLTVTALEGALAFGPLAFAPSQLVQSFGLSVTLAGAVMMLYGVGGLIYALSARRWLRVLGEPGLASLGGVLIAISLLMLGWAEHFVLGGLACGLGGLGFYMLHNTLQTQATQMAPQARGAAVALFASVLFIGQSVGVSIVALFVDGASTGVVFSFAALGIVLLGLSVSRKVG